MQQCTINSNTIAKYFISFACQPTSFSNWLVMIGHLPKKRKLDVKQVYHTTNIAMYLT